MKLLFKKLRKLLKQYVYLLILIGYLSAYFTKDFYLLITFIGFTLIAIALEIQKTNRFYHIKEAMELLTKVMEKDKNHCPQCGNSDLTNIEDNRFVCNYCSHVFTKEKYIWKTL